MGTGTGVSIAANLAHFSPSTMSITGDFFLQPGSCTQSKGYKGLFYHAGSIKPGQQECLRLNPLYTYKLILPKSYPSPLSLGYNRQHDSP